jgi:hypothetical protein
LILRSVLVRVEFEPMDRRDLAATWAPTLLNDAAAVTVPMDERRKMATNGTAMPDGSFPIPDVEHLHSAIRLARTPEQRRHVIKRARALGKTDMIPDSWNSEAAAYDADELPAGMVRLHAQLDEVMALLHELTAQAQTRDPQAT